MGGMVVCLPFVCRCNEFKRFCPVIRVAKFHGNQEQRVRGVHCTSTHACTSACLAAHLPAALLHLHLPALLTCLPAPVPMQDNQKDTVLQPGKFDVVVTSYEMVIK